MKIGAISESLEDYLEIIFHLIQEKDVARVKDIAQGKGVSMASVNTALKRLVKSKLITYEHRGLVRLTREGEDLAKRVSSRHDFVQKFLSSILQVPEEIADQDACSFEHFMSPETFRRLVAFFEFVELSGLDIRERFNNYLSRIPNFQPVEACPQPDCPYRGQGPGHRHRGRRIKTLMEMVPGECGSVVRIKAPGSIRQRLIDMGVLPNVEIRVERIAPLGDPIEVKLRGYHLSIRKEDANTIIVVPCEPDVA